MVVGQLVACDSGCTAGAALRGAHSLDVLAPRRESRRALRRGHTSRSLDADVAVSTVSGPLFNGTIIGIVTDDLPKTAEDSPLLRKCSLHNKLDRPKRKVHDANYIEFYKKWRSLENIADVKSDMRKMPRFAIRSWLLGIFSGTRSSSSSLRRAPPLLDRESAV
ncbi:unnamed protein product [Parnassius mnemosyne]|uniref:Uncharacterized protein n=1 Tax=Parnassius mnemosyne TaxID=213953 RepID=A0AAV1KG21_9NEOP